MRVLLLTGKGGSGTTALAAATAVTAARCGVKALVLSTSGGPSLGDVLGVDALGVDALVGGAAGGDGDGGVVAHRSEPSLSVLSGAASGQLAHGWRSVRPYLRRLLGGLDVPASEARSLASLPGVRDLVSLLALRRQVDDGPWDLVVVDGGAHLQALLTTPQALARVVDSVWTPERRAGLQGGCPDPLLALATARLRGELDGVLALLHGGTTSVRLVMTPDSAGLAWARRTFTALAVQGYGVDGVLANRTLPDGGDDAWRSAWTAAQRAVLAQADDAFAPVPVRRVPYLTLEPTGTDALAVLGAHALVAREGGVAGAVEQLLQPPPPCRAVEVRRTRAGYDLLLPAPFARASEVDVRRDGDELRVRVQAASTVVPLPSVLRRCVATGATVTGGRLAVHFVPDPRQWPARAAASSSSSEERP